MFLSIGAANSQTALSSFAAANKLYDEGKFSEAASGYEKIVASGERSAALYFNLGNALFKSSQIGKSIAAYRKAEQMSPRDPDIRANLRFAQNQVQGPTLRSSKLDLLIHTLTLNEWAVMTAAAFWVVFLLLTIIQLRPQLARAIRSLLILAIVATLASGAGLGYSIYLQGYARTAIVVLPDAVVRQRPVEGSPNGFPVHDGAELRVLNERDDWLQVSPDPSRIGWIRRDQIVLTSS